LEPFLFIKDLYMSRPSFISTDDISRWSKEIDNDDRLPKGLIESPVIREVCYAGLWLCEELEKLSCPDSLIVRIQFTAGKMSFGKDVWQVHRQFLDDYKNNKLNIASDSKNLN